MYQSRYKMNTYFLRFKNLIKKISYSAMKRFDFLDKKTAIVAGGLIYDYIRSKVS